MRKAVIGELLRSFGDSTQVLSLFADLDRSKRGPREMALELKNLYREALELCPEGRREALSGLERALSPYVGGVAEEFPRGLAVFVDLDSGRTSELALPAPVPSQVVLRGRPYLTPLLATLTPFRRTLIAVVSPKRSAFFSFEGGRMRLLEAVEREDVPRKVKSSGWYGLKDRRIERWVEQQLLDHFKALAALTVERASDGDFRRVAVGGSPENASLFFELIQPVLSPLGAEALVLEELGEVFDPLAVESVYLERSMRDFWEEGERAVASVMESPLSARGLRGVVRALNYRAVHQLVVGEPYRARGVMCPSCGTLGLDEEECSGCGGSAVLVDDLLEEMIHLALAQNADVMVLGRPTLLREHDEVGALLRFEV